MPATLEKTIELGQELVRLGVCDKTGPQKFAFSAEFISRAVVKLIQLKADPKQLPIIHAALRDLVEEHLILPVAACFYTLEYDYDINERAGEGFEAKADYIAFCHALLKAAWRDYQSGKPGNYIIFLT